MKPKARVFIGCSVEALRVAEAVQRYLDYGTEPVVWNQGIFQLSETSIESLIKELDKVDFGIFVFNADDVVNIRGQTSMSTRDNVIFELGLFVGRLGRERSFIIMLREQGDLRLPTDLLGITPAKYNAKREDGNIKAATTPACADILEAIQKLGPLARSGEAVRISRQEEEEPGEELLQHEVTVGSNEQAAQPETEAGPETGTGAEAGPEAETDLLSNMINAFLTGDTTRGEEAYREALEAEDSVDEKLQIQSIYQQLQYRQGDVTALDKLENLIEQAAEHPAALRLVHRCIGMSYEQVDDFLKAGDAYEAAAAAAQVVEQRAVEVVSAAARFFKAKKREAAFKRIGDEIGRIDNRRALSTLYRGLAELYGESGDLDLQVVALHKAVENRPNDTKLRFSTARSSEENDLSALALMHYRTLLRFDSDDSSALNNIAIVYSDWEMRIKQVESYKKAAADGLSLAAANLAYVYMNSGFLAEAKEVLEKVKGQEDESPNVGRAIASLVEKEEAEAQLETTVVDKAREQYQAILSFAQAYFQQTSVPPRFEGVWCFADGIEVEVVQKEGALEMHWERNDQEYTVSARTQNRGALIDKYSRKDRYFPINLGDKGYAHLSEDEKKLSIMLLKNKRHSFLTLTRREQQTA